jgi:hypothetical protein
VVGFCECSSEPSGYIKGGELLAYLEDNKCSVHQTPCLIWNLKVCYCVDKSLLIGIIMKQSMQLKSV